MANTRHSDPTPAAAKKTATVAACHHSPGAKHRKKIQVTAVPRRIQKYAPKANMTKFRKTKCTDEESVQVVKMLTGVLYMYRGQNPRAEFVRKV